MRKFVFKFMELKTDYIARFFRKIQWHKSRKIRLFMKNVVAAAEATL